MRAVDGVENWLDGLGGSRNFFDDGRASGYAEGVEISGTAGGEVVVAGKRTFE